MRPQMQAIVGKAQRSQGGYKRVSGFIFFSSIIISQGLHVMLAGSVPSWLALAI
jgi:hypothetical protein